MPLDIGWAQKSLKSDDVELLCDHAKQNQVLLAAILNPGYALESAIKLF